MNHSITIGHKNTWDDWHLIPTSRPLFNPPTVKTTTISVPGGDGVLDLTESLAGRPTYNNRIGSWEFIVDNGHQEWYELYSEIMTYLHGKRLTAVLEDEPLYFYEGRFSVNTWKSDKNWSKITIDYDVGPYKKSIENDGSDWLWDTFNFETGIIRNYKNIVVSGTLSLSVYGGINESVPTITCSASGMTVRFRNVTYDLIKGVNVIPDIILESGENVLVFGGTGTISVENIGGWL